MTEVGAYGYECAEQAGLHVNESEFIAEVIDPATGGPARDGELVLTNLGRVGSPVIRYRTGDRARVASAPCACGRTFVRLEGGILGRLDDMLIVRGANGFPASIDGVAACFGYHARRATWRQAAAETRRRTRPRPPPRCRGSSIPPSPSSSATSGASRSTPTSTATRPRSRFSRSTTRSSASRSRRSAARS